MKEEIKLYKYLFLLMFTFFIISVFITCDLVNPDLTEEPEFLKENNSSSSTSSTLNPEIFLQSVNVFVSSSSSYSSSSSSSNSIYVNIEVSFLTNYYPQRVEITLYNIYNSTSRTENLYQYMNEYNYLYKYGISILFLLPNEGGNWRIHRIKIILSNNYTQEFYYNPLYPTLYCYDKDNKTYFTGVYISYFYIY